MKRKSVFSKLAVLLLAAVMVVSLLPAAALAADPMYFEVVIDGATTQYATAGEAYAAVEAALPSGGKATIKLLDDYTGEGLVITADKNLDLTFELNTHLDGYQVGRFCRNRDQCFPAEQRK